MGLICRYNEWSGQPPVGTPLRADGHWSVHGLKGCWLLNEATGTSVVNAATNKLADASPAVWAENGVKRLRGPYTRIATAQTFVALIRTGSDVSAYQQVIGHGGRYLNNGDFTCLGIRIKGGYVHGIASPSSSDLTWYNNLKASITANTVYLAVFVLRGWGANTVGELWLNGVLVSSYTYTAGDYGVTTDPIALGMYSNSTGTTTDALFTGVIHFAAHYNYALPASAIAHYSPWQVAQPQALTLQLAGGTSYTENLTALAESYASVADIATFVDAGTAIAAAGVSVTDTVAMLEGLLSTAQAADTVSDVAQRVDSLLAVIQAVGSLQEAAALVDNLVDSITTTSSITDSVVTAGMEALQTDVAAATSVQDVVVALEQLSSTIATQTSVTDSVVSATAENLLSAATAITSVVDLQLMVDNLTIMAQSQASIAEIAAYLEQLATTITAGASVTDVLVTAFVGRYIFRDLCTPRSFADLCTPRSFRDLCAPRGTA